MCLNPKWIYKKGRYKEDNYRGSAGDFYELGTFSKCGCCTQCINEKSNNWVVRNHYEAINPKNERKSFITLTYEENPIIIIKKDIQDFVKRLRINLDRSTGEKIRIFTCSEYGELYNRPHAHIILYGFDDEKAKYKGINKKGNLYYESEIIQDTWGLGRTSYQKFDDNEIPYISLYNTANEQFKRAYKLNHDKLKKLEDYATNIRHANQRKNLYLELNELREELDKSKKEWIAIKESNTWSKSMGWEEFERQYYKQVNYAWEEYIGEMSITTPSSWVKRLANQGDMAAAEEMFRRENSQIKETNEERERLKNLGKLQAKKKEEIIKYHEQKTEIAEL